LENGGQYKQTLENILPGIGWNPIAELVIGVKSLGLAACSAGEGLPPPIILETRVTG